MVIVIKKDVLIASNIAMQLKTFETITLGIAIKRNTML